jgi:hypothetical protein
VPRVIKNSSGPYTNLALILTQETTTVRRHSHGQLGWRHEAVVKLLVDTGKVDVDSRDNYGQTPLSLADERGREAVVKLLELARSL